MAGSKSMNNYYGYVYLITNIINGKIYIGQHASPKFDKSYYGSGVAFTKAVKKYGKPNFKREVLAYCETKEELDATEIYEIAIYRKNNMMMYNIAIGGMAGMKGIKLSDETKRKIGQASMGRFRPQSAIESQRASIKKYHHDNPDIAKNRMAKHKGEVWSEDRRAKLRKPKTKRLDSDICARRSELKRQEWANRTEEEKDEIRKKISIKAREAWVIRRNQNVK